MQDSTGLWKYHPPARLVPGQALALAEERRLQHPDGVRHGEYCPNILLTKYHWHDDPHRLGCVQHPTVITQLL
jgi:hypothetical protein